MVSSQHYVSATNQNNAALTTKFASTTTKEFRADRLFDGDPINADAFEDLVSVKTGNAIGSKGKKHLLPWLRSNTSAQPYLAVLCDPRSNSQELRDTIKDLVRSLPPIIKASMIIVNADTPSENRRWIKKNSFDETLNVMSDEKMTWMRTYTALGDDKWGMTLFVLAEGKVKRIVRDLDRYTARQTIIKAVNADEVRLS